MSNFENMRHQESYTWNEVGMLYHTECCSNVKTLSLENALKLISSSLAINNI